MTHEAFWSCISAITTTLTGFLCLSALINRWRRPGKKNRVILSMALISILLIEMGLFFALKDLSQANLAVTLLHVFCLGLVPIFSPWRRGRLLFILTLTYTLVSMINLSAHLFSAALGPTNLFVRLTISLILLVLIHFFFRPGFHHILQPEVSVWYCLSTIPLTFSAVFFIVATTAFETKSLPLMLFPREASTHVTYLILLAIPLCACISFYQLFWILNRLYLTQMDKTVLNTHLTSTQKQKKAQQQDLFRHLSLSSKLSQFFNEIDAELDARDCAGALASSLELDAQILASWDQKTSQPYTGNAILDTVLNDHACIAKAEQIDLIIKLHLPLTPGIDMPGLAVVLSNALENAINACKKLEPGKSRRIYVVSHVTSAQFFLQISNTFAGELHFDPFTGCPVTLQEGHGYGTRSMAAFAQAHGGTLDFRVEDGWFTLRLLI